MALRGEGRGCLKTGCIGCAVVGGLAILVVVVLAALALSGSRVEPRIEAVERSQPVGPAPLEAGAPAEPGRVVLDVEMALFEVRPGPPGSAIRVEGSYDSARYELEDRHELVGETGWSYRLSFHRRGLLPTLVENERANRLVLFLPAGTPIALEAHFRFVDSSLELGGLFLTEADLDIGLGKHEVRFDEPLVAPMESLHVQGSLGELSLVSVGNASPGTLELGHRAGEVDVDLRGAWSRDATIDVRCGLGECRVRAPRDVNLDLEHVAVMLGEESRPEIQEIRQANEEWPTLHLSVRSQVGEVRVER